MEIQSEEFGFNCTISIEISTCNYHNKCHNNLSNEVKAKMDFNSHFSNDYDHNETTTFEHMKKFILWMYNRILFIKDIIIYDTTDGCSKNIDVQIKCGYYMSWHLHIE